MKKFSILIAVLCIFSGLYAAPVDVATAKKAGSFFLQSEVYTANKTNDLQLSYTSGSSDNTQSYFYVFNSGNTFVIVSADDRCTPILGYSYEGNFKTDKMSPEVSWWLRNYSNEISYVINNNIPATAAISNSWKDLITGTKPMQKSATLVGAMLKTTWDQMPYYNDACPFDNNFSERTVTGCVATAMAQVLHYWKYPASGIGSYSYYDNRYGQLSASFASTNYGWNDMPNNLKTSNDAVATLMYQCGISVNMHYGIATNDGSSAYVIYDNGANKICAETALKSNFGYASSLKGLKRAAYTDAEWITMLESELDAHRPIIYAGFEAAGAGHCFIFDGYNSAHPYFHINWGWSGAYNGFFAISALNPGGVGTGGGTGDFNAGQQAIIGIRPADLSLSGIRDNAPDNNLIRIFPNPAQNVVNIALPQTMSKVNLVSVLDIQGREIFSQSPQDSKNMTLNTGNMPDGIYSVRVFTDSGVMTSRLVIQR